MDKATSQLEKISEELRQAGDPSKILELAEKGIKLLNKPEQPIIWADFQKMVGDYLMQSVAVTGKVSDKLFSIVLNVYNNALSVFIPEQMLESWRETQMNVGTTYMYATHYRIGDAKTNVESAIQAFEKSLDIPLQKSDPFAWLMCNIKLAEALEIASRWRGPTAFAHAAQAYESYLGMMDKERFPEDFALHTVKMFSCIYKSGLDNESFLEEEIQACENARKILQAETQLFYWATANLLLGSCYRVRHIGSREQNLERAIESLHNALFVFTQETTPNEWYAVHYNLGPAYVWRIQGDHAKNLESGIQSLKIAIAATPRDQAPEVWASLQLTLGKAYFEYFKGDREKNIVLAINAFESVLEVVPPDPGSPLWCGASHGAGKAYLLRRGGDHNENIEKAIAVLKAVQQMSPISDAPDTWCALSSELATAYMRRTQGVPASNRENAIKYFKAALAVPSDAWIDEASWSTAQATLLFLYLDTKAERIGRSFAREEEPDAIAETLTQQAMNEIRPDDPFGLANQARQEFFAGIGQPVAGDEHYADDLNSAFPAILDEAVRLQRHYIHQFLKTEAVAQRATEGRTSLEIQRWKLFNMIFAHISEKYEMAYRTEELLNKVEQGEQGFVLLLRGFAARRQPYKAGRSIVRSTDFSEIKERKKLIKKLLPVPMIWTSNPVESPPLDLEMAKGDYEALGYRIEMGSTWEDAVQSLISAASFVVVHNPRMTPGLVTEIKLLETVGRLDNTFFYSPGPAEEALELNQGSLKLFTDEAIEHIRQSISGRGLQKGTLPVPTRPWVSGKERERIETETAAIEQWLKQLSGNRTALSIDLELDGYAYLLGSLLILEEIDRIPPVMLSLSKIYDSFGENDLMGAAKLAKVYSKFANKLRNAYEKTSTEMTTISRNAECLRVAFSQRE